MKNKFHFVSNNVFATNDLWNDLWKGIHLQDTGTHILSNLYLKFLSKILNINLHSSNDCF